MEKLFFSTTRTFFITVGIMFLMLGFYPFFKSIVSNPWPTTEGVITLSKSYPSSYFRIFSGTPYHTTIEYEYTVDERLYHSNKVEFGIGASLFLLGDFASRLLERYPAGKFVRVYVNPKNPQETVLERSPSMGTSVAWVFIGILASAVGLFANLFKPEEPQQYDPHRPFLTSGVKT